MNKKFKLNGVNVELSKEKLQDMLKEFDKKTIEFKVDRASDWDYDIILYIDGEEECSMEFDKDEKPDEKIGRFNTLIRYAIEKYGGKENFATQEDINNIDTKLWGIDLYNACVSKKVDVSIAYNAYLKYQYNCYSKSEKVIKDIAEALEPLTDYIDKAFRGE